MRRRLEADIESPSSSDSDGSDEDPAPPRAPDEGPESSLMLEMLHYDVLMHIGAVGGPDVRQLMKHTSVDLHTIIRDLFVQKFRYAREVGIRTIVDIGPRGTRLDLRAYWQLMNSVLSDYHVSQKVVIDDTKLFSGLSDVEILAIRQAFPLAHFPARNEDWTLVRLLTALVEVPDSFPIMVRLMTEVLPWTPERLLDILTVMCMQTANPPLPWYRIVGHGLNSLFWHTTIDWRTADSSTANMISSFFISVFHPRLIEDFKALSTLTTEPLNAYSVIRGPQQLARYMREFHPGVFDTNVLRILEAIPQAASRPWFADRPPAFKSTWSIAQMLAYMRFFKRARAPAVAHTAAHALEWPNAISRVLCAFEWNEACEVARRLPAITSANASAMLRVLMALIRHPQNQTLNIFVLRSAVRPDELVFGAFRTSTLLYDNIDYISAYVDRLADMETLLRSLSTPFGYQDVAPPRALMRPFHVSNMCDELFEIYTKELNATNRVALTQRMHALVALVCGSCVQQPLSTADIQRILVDFVMFNLQNDNEAGLASQLVNVARVMIENFGDPLQLLTAPFVPAGADNLVLQYHAYRTTMFLVTDYLDVTRRPVTAVALRDIDAERPFIAALVAGLIYPAPRPATAAETIDLLEAAYVRVAEDNDDEYMLIPVSARLVDVLILMLKED